ncbi:MAG: nucleotide exchange factor GrpE, partial [bacterium]
EVGIESGLTESAGQDQLGSEPTEGDPADLDPSVIEPDPLAELTRERDSLQERWLRTRAELDNFRKRSRRELIETRRFAKADVLRSLLEIFDNFERARRVIQENGRVQQDLNGYRAGIELIYQQFQEILAEQGLSRIEALGEEFDPNQHEAVQQLEQEGAEAGQVIEVVQTGYKLDDLVLRPSRVIVAK